MDITVILNAHNEGILAHPTCSSLELAKVVAEKEGIAVEVCVIIDRPNPETVDFFSHRAPSDWKLICVDFGDLGRSRNEGVRFASGKWVAFLDADDIFGKNWLLAAYTAAINDRRLVVWHPDINIYFGREPRIFKHVDMDDESIVTSSIICSNYWTALCFAPRTLLERAPYPETQHGRQIGYEDWAWNQDVIALGAIHKIVPGTGHLIRTKNTSLVRLTAAARCIPRPSDYLPQLLLQRERDQRGESFPSRSSQSLR